MTRKPDTGGAATSTSRGAGALKSLRSQIDKLDIQILKLINERAGKALEIGRLKNDQGAEVFSPAREEEVLQHVLEANKGPLDPATVRAIFREIMSGSRALQKVLRVAYLGPEYSFSHLAAIERFGQAVEFIGVGSIAAVFEDINRGHADFGVVPLENSTDGGVADTLDMFLRMPQIRICAEVRLRIHHNLLANCEQQEIRRVYSKPQALSQCRNWLNKNLPHAKLIDMASTADAARLAQQEPGAAAVASRQAAVRFGLRILFENIEDSPYNETRFAVIGHQKSPRTGHDKTAVMFRVPHQPGSLVEALDVFRQNKINLTWIESFPARVAARPEYVFFVDFEGHTDDPKVSRALKALQDRCEEVTVLGSFPIASLSDSV
ncbi:MAG TPA: prephenate dehydratase [Gemmataceae bacterium]|nr:prephenate dehydratase [Gemmataceae bacterium]